MLDFIYNGEVTLDQPELDQFLASAQELQLKGLTNSSSSDGNDWMETETQNKNLEENAVPDPDTKHFSVKSETIEKIEDNVVTVEDYYDEANSDIIENYDLNNTVEDLNNTVEEMYEKNNGVWQCKVCKKTSKLRGDMKRHIEVHVEGASYPCNVCGKSYRSGNSLRKHEITYHK